MESDRADMPGKSLPPHHSHQSDTPTVEGQVVTNLPERSSTPHRDHLRESLEGSEEEHILFRDTISPDPNLFVVDPLFPPTAAGTVTPFETSLFSTNPPPSYSEPPGTVPFESSFDNDSFEPIYFTTHRTSSSSLSPTRRPRSDLSNISESSSAEQYRAAHVDPHSGDHFLGHVTHSSLTDIIDGLHEHPTIQDSLGDLHHPYKVDLDRHPETIELDSGSESVLGNGPDLKEDTNLAEIATAGEASLESTHIITDDIDQDRSSTPASPTNPSAPQPPAIPLQHLTEMDHHHVTENQKSQSPSTTAAAPPPSHLIFNGDNHDLTAYGATFGGIDKIVTPDRATITEGFEVAGLIDISSAGATDFPLIIADRDLKVRSDAGATFADFDNLLGKTDATLTTAGPRDSTGTGLRSYQHPDFVDFLLPVDDEGGKTRPVDPLTPAQVRSFGNVDLRQTGFNTGPDRSSLTPPTSPDSSPSLTTDAFTPPKPALSTPTSIENEETNKDITELASMIEKVSIRSSSDDKSNDHGTIHPDLPNGIESHNAHTPIPLRNGSGLNGGDNFASFGGKNGQLDPPTHQNDDYDFEDDGMVGLPVKSHDSPLEIVGDHKGHVKGSSTTAGPVSSPIMTHANKNGHEVRNKMDGPGKLGSPQTAKSPSVPPVGKKVNLATPSHPPKGVTHPSPVKASVTTKTAPHTNGTTVGTKPKVTAPNTGNNTALEPTKTPGGPTHAPGPKLTTAGPAAARPKTMTKKSDYSHVQSKCGSLSFIKAAPLSAKVKTETHVDHGSVGAQANRTPNATTVAHNGTSPSHAAPKLTNGSATGNSCGSKKVNTTNNRTPSAVTTNGILNVGSAGQTVPGQSPNHVLQKKPDYLKSVQSKVGSLENASYKPPKIQKKLENVKLDFKNKAKSKIGSLDNASYVPAGGNVKIQSHKLDFKEKATSKVQSKCVKSPDNTKSPPTEMHEIAEPVN